MQHLGGRGYTRSMPKDRKEPLLRLADARQKAIEREAEERKAAIAQTAGALTGAYPPAALEQLREDWPE